MDTHWTLRSAARLDAWADVQAEHLRNNAVVDRAFYALTESANHSLLWHGLNGLRLLDNRPDKRTGAVNLAVTLGIESALVNGVLKRCFRRSRPLIDSPSTHRLRKPRTTSFPSGHATSAFCAALCLGYGARKRTRVALLVLAAAVSYSRIHVRLHHASDVLGGAALGVLFGVIARRWQRPSNSNKRTGVH